MSKATAEANACPEDEIASPIARDIYKGKCHVCKKTGVGITCCSWCEHWLCKDCRTDLWGRTLAAIKVAIKAGSKRESKGDCCGPR